ncbi:MAG: AraC family transcriptional regulator [Bacteroidota bacterium]|nr:AraC family transcriptional regulator [Bacteroidota bacterium]
MEMITLKDIPVNPASLTFYHQQVLRIKKRVFPHDDLCDRIARAKQFMDNFYSGPIDLDSMAEEACFSKFHFIRLFKKNYGRTPYQYLTEVRMAAAKELLQSGMPVSEVCASVGFDSVSSFTGLFKKITGTTPFVFQKKKRSGQKRQF